MLPDVIENQVIEIKDALIENGIKDGLHTATECVVDIGKSISGIFTGKFENISQVQTAIGSGGVIDTFSDLIDKASNKIYQKGIINSQIKSVITGGKDIILNNVTSNIKNEMNFQERSIHNIGKYVDNFNEYLKSKDFNKIKESYITSLKNNNYSQNTIKTYSSIIHKFTTYLKNQIAIYNEKEFIKYFNSYILYLKQVKNVSQNYLYLVTVVVKKFLEFNNIHFLDSITTPKRIKSPPNFLTQKEVKQLLDSITWDENSDSDFRIITKLRDKLIVTLLYSSGLRVSELINLTVDNVNFEGKQLSIVGKNNSRVILLDESTKQLIQKYLEKRTQKSNYLVVNKSGNPLTPRYVQLMIKKYGNESGIEKKITPHILRHSYATHLFEQGVNIKIIQQLLGHSNLSTTQIYSQDANN